MKPFALASCKITDQKSSLTFAFFNFSNYTASLSRFYLVWIYFLGKRIMQSLTFSRYIIKNIFMLSVYF